jgi:hypothetical protein
MKFIHMPQGEFLSKSLDERRDFFIEKDPLFIDLEQKLFEYGGERLIYMPIMIIPEFFVAGESVKLNTTPELNYVGGCHDISHQLATIGDVQMWTGFYLTSDEKWRPHSWIQHKDLLIDVTGNTSRAAFGVALTKEELEIFGNTF